jgi:hypothetical protein
MIQRRAADLGTRVKIGCPIFRATGITAYLKKGSTLENAQAMVPHDEALRSQEITLNEVERIAI